MERVSVNGRLVPLDGSSITNEYTGHFLKVSYNQLIQGHSIFSKDRVDVDPEGIFRFFVPKKELLATELIIVEAYAPDGEMMGSQSYSHGALNSADIPIGAEDNTQELEIKINPKIITFNQSSPAESATKKLNGRVIDISGDGKTSHLEVLIMISEDASADFDVQNGFSVVILGRKSVKTDQ